MAVLSFRRAAEPAASTVTSRPLVPKKMFLTSSGVEVEYLYLDKGKKDTVLFINGWLLRFSMWSQQMDSLNDSNLLFFNNRGHGRTKIGSSTPESYLSDCAKDAKELLSAHGVLSPHVVAFSMGGAISSFLARELSGRLRSLCLVSPVVTNPLKTFPLGVLLEKAIPFIREALEQKLFLKTANFAMGFMRNDFSLFLTWVYFKQLTRSGASYHRFAKYLRDSMDVDAKTFAMAFESMVINGQRIRDGFKLLNCPVLVLRGKNDFLVDERSLAVIHDVLPHAQVIEFENATHYPNTEEADLFNRTLADFLYQKLSM